MSVENLSPSSRATKILMGDQLPDGYKINEIANSLGRPASWVSERLNELRDEVLLQTGHFFPLSDHEFTALEASILEHGIQVDVLLGEHLPLIDGRHRLQIAQKHRLETPCRLLEGLTADQEHDLYIALNAARRQLNRAQKRTLVQAELMRNPARSDRLIASICGVHWDTVGVIRAEIAEQQQAETDSIASALSASALAVSADLPWSQPDADPLGDLLQHRDRQRTSVTPTERVDRAGAVRPAPTPRTEPAEAPPLGHVTCSHGQRHAIYRSRGTYRLEPQ
jgi:ParB-like chromosome segregation protein Spo0J